MSEQVHARRFSLRKRCCFGVGLMCLGLACAAGLAEWAYRRQWLDTYAVELRAYNPPDIVAATPQRPTLLALGDSFTAGSASYANALRKLLPEWRIVNGGVAGTCIAQHTIIAPRRLRAFAPDVCVYQLFVGNDLFDMRYPARGANLSPGRRLYWMLATHLRALSFINYRLGQWRAGESTALAPFPTAAIEDAAFSPDRYDARERLYLSAEPTLIDDQALVTPRRAADYARLLLGLEDLRRECRAANCALVLLVIPHAAQVSPVYAERMRALGAVLAAPDRMAAPDYPFLEGIRHRFEGADSAMIIVDPLAALQAAERAGTTVYFANDGHLNPSGQQIVARQVLAALPTELRALHGATSGNGSSD